MATKIRIWTRTDDMGDGSSLVSLHSTKAEALVGVKDWDGFEQGFDYYGYPVFVQSAVIDIVGCELVEGE